MQNVKIGTALDLAPDAEEGLLNFSVSLAFLVGPCWNRAIACLRRATAGTRPCVGKHSVRAFHPSAHARILSAISAMEWRLAFACCESVVVVGWRPTMRRIKGSVRIEVVWFGRIACGNLHYACDDSDDICFGIKIISATFEND